MADGRTKDSFRVNLNNAGAGFATGSYRPKVSDLRNQGCLDVANEVSFIRVGKWEFRSHLNMTALFVASPSLLTKQWFRLSSRYVSRPTHVIVALNESLRYFC